MTWLNAAAWFGLASLLVPLLIHLLAQRKARPQKFPTLRFLATTPLVQARRTRLTDLLLLAVRTAILLLAVLALAQPLLLTRDRLERMEAALARAIIVDSSASMQRVGTTGERALDAARNEARRLMTEATTGVVLQTADPAAAIAGASQWLAQQGGRRELVLISDFQTGTLEPADLAGVAVGVGVQLIRSDAGANAALSPIETRTRYGTFESISSVALEGDRTSVQWRLRAFPDGSAPSTIAFAAAPSEMAHATAARDAANTFGAPQPGVYADKVLLVHPQYERDANLLASARPVNEAWMGDVIVALRADSLLLMATRESEPAATARPLDAGAAVSENVVTIARSRTGLPLVQAALATVDGVERLALFSFVPPGSLASAALAAATSRALANQTPSSEMNPEQLTDAALAGMRREASGRSPMAADATRGASDARWVWLVVLALLGLEWRLRRGRASSANRTSAAGSGAAALDGAKVGTSRNAAA